MRGFQQRQVALEGGLAQPVAAVGLASLDRMTALGASLLEHGVTFRVWAPGCRTVDVTVDGRSTEPLAPRGAGLFEATLEGVIEGARYRYRLDGERYRPDAASRYQPEGVHGPS